MWLEIVEDEWLAALRIMVQDGRPVVGEVRIFPNVPGPRLAGQWSVEWLGPDAERLVPPGGLTTRRLRSFPLQKPLAEALPELMRKWTGWLRASYAGSEPLRADELPLTYRGIVGAAARGPRRRSREAGVSDLELARLASDYVEACRDPQTNRAPAKAIARRRELSDRRARDLIYAARERGLLSGGSRGRPGGGLTPEALELLKGSDE